MPYTANKKPSGLDTATTPLAGGNEIVLSQSGNVTRASLTAVEAMVHAANAKTTKNPVDGTEVVTVRQTDNVLRQVALDNIVKPLLITNAMVNASAGIVDTKLATISTAGKVSNSATTATNASTANAIVARDGSGNFNAGTITATLSGNATTATTLATGRTIAMTGDIAYTSPAFNGGANVTAAATIQPDAVTTAKILDSNVTTGKIADDNVTFGKIQNSAAAGLSVVGRNTNSAGDFAEINAATDGHVLRRDGTALAFGQVGTAGIADLAVNSGKIALGAITDTKLRDSSGYSVIGRIGSTNGTPNDIIAGTDGHVLRRSGSFLEFGQIGASSITDTSISNAKLRNSAGLSIIGRSSNTTGTPADITASTDGFALRRLGDTIGFGTVGNAGIRDGAITEGKIEAGAVTFAKLTLPSNFPIQVVQAVKTNTQGLGVDDTWTDISGLTLTITKQSASTAGSVRIQAVIQHSSNNGNHGPMFRIVRGATAIGLATTAGSRERTTAASFYPNSGLSIGTTVIDFIDTTPLWTTLLPFAEYKIQAKTWVGVTSYINRSNSDADAGSYPRSISTLTLTELTP